MFDFYENEGPPLPLEVMLIFFIGYYALWKIAQWWYGQRALFLGFTPAETKEKRREIRKDFDPSGVWAFFIGIAWAIALGVFLGIRNGGLPNPFSD